MRTCIHNYFNINFIQLYDLRSTQSIFTLHVNKTSKARNKGGGGIYIICFSMIIIVIIVKLTVM